MKTYMKNIMAAVATFGIGVTFIQNASATLSWSSPLTLNSPNLVGTAKGVTGAGQGNWTYEQAVAQAILNLGANQTTSPFILGEQTVLNTGPTDYNGTYNGGATSSGGAGQQIGSGWDFVIAKYDGPNAGYILFYLGGEAANIPQFPTSFWTTSEQYGISGWTAFNATGIEIIPPVPEPSTVIAGALMLVPLGVQAVRRLRNRK